GILCDFRGSLSLIAGLLFFFLLVLGYGLHLGLDVDCGCFGAHDPEAEAFHGLRPALYRDLGMIAAVFYLFVWRWWRGHRPMSVTGLSKIISRRR
ncbi:MAG: hypothetical protein MI892_19905, partial [Desulfobacterales bacterium]|nr:hypothetical protein [Desulfobacterales bacterium]